MAKTKEEIRKDFKKNHPNYWKEYYRKNPNRWRKYYYKKQKSKFFKNPLSKLLTKLRNVLKLSMKLKGGKQ
jgi:hypothetical protein